MKNSFFLISILLAFCISNVSGQTITVEKADSPSPKYKINLTRQSQYIELENEENYTLFYEDDDGNPIQIEADRTSPNKFEITFLYDDSKKKPKEINFKLRKKDSSDSALFTIEFAVPKAENLTKLSFPTFSQNDYSAFNTYRRNRHLIIDANPNPYARLNTQLFKYKKEKTSKDSEEENDKSSADYNKDNEEKVMREILAKAHAIPKNGSIAIFIKNYNFWNIEEISISMNEEDYTYNKGLIDIRNQVLTDDEDSSGTDEKENANEAKEGENTNQDKTTQDPFEVYLKNVYTNWEDIKYLNFNDLAQVESFKDTLTKSINENKKELTPTQQSLYSKIVSWYPDYVSLTPIPLSSVDADEVEFKLKIKNENETTETQYDLRTYRIVGGLSFNISSTLFLTGLVNGDVYADSVEIDGEKQLRAKIDDTNKRFTAGIGVNTEITYRSGWMVNPTTSIGFFVPFDEDITPNIALGGGLSLITRRVRLSVTGGLAVGQVNAIEDRYIDRNLADFPNLINENLSTKRWDKAWQLGIGLSYQLKE